MIKEKYARTSDKEEEKKDKVILSDDTYAVCEFLDNLTTQINLMRLK